MYNDQICRSTDSVEPPGSPKNAVEVRQQLLRMILRNEAERKTRLKPHLDLEAKHSAAELRIGT